jgi:hypothetical protein
MKFVVIACCFSAMSCAPAVQGIVAKTTKPQSGNPGPRIASYCVAQRGRSVGNGECWTLADEAFKSAGARRPGSDMRVWGRVVNPAKESLKPGDVIEFQSAWFTDGTITGSAHTAVVVKGGGWEHATIAEQNWGKKNVRIREMNLAGLRSGIFKVYRAE